MKAATIDRLYREHQPDLLRALTRRFPDHAEDALSDTWTQFAGMADDHVREETAFGWLYVCAARRALKQIKRENAHRSQGPAAELSDDRDIVAIVIGRDRLRELLDFITTEDIGGHPGPLRTEARRRAVAARLTGYSYRELAELTGTSARQVDRATAEGQKLARELTRYQP